MASTTALFERRGVGHYDPEVCLQTEHIKSWLEVWNASSASDRERITKAWHFTLAELKSQGAKDRQWRLATGHMSATMCILLDNGWEPLFPNKWRYELTGEEAALAVSDDRPFANAAIVAFFARCIRLNLWKNESAKGNGSATGWKSRHRLYNPPSAPRSS